MVSEVNFPSCRVLHRNRDALFKHTRCTGKKKKKTVKNNFEKKWNDSSFKYFTHRIQESYLSQ